MPAERFIGSLTLSRCLTAERRICKLNGRRKPTTDLLIKMQEGWKKKHNVILNVETFSDHVVVKYGINRPSSQCQTLNRPKQKAEVHSVFVSWLVGHFNTRRPLVICTISWLFLSVDIMNVQICLTFFYIKFTDKTQWKPCLFLQKIALNEWQSFFFWKVCVGRGGGAGRSLNDFLTFTNVSAPTS